MFYVEVPPSTHHVEQLWLFWHEKERVVKRQLLHCAKRNVGRSLRACEELSDLIVVAGEHSDALVVFASDDDAQVAVNPGLMVGFPQLLVEKPWGKMAHRSQIAAAGVVRLERFENPSDSALLLWSEPLEAALKGRPEIETERQGSTLRGVQGAEKCLRDRPLLAALGGSQGIKPLVFLIGKVLLDGLKRNELDPVVAHEDVEHRPFLEGEHVGDFLGNRDLMLRRHGDRHRIALLTYQYTTCKAGEK